MAPCLRRLRFPVGRAAGGRRLGFQLFKFRVFLGIGGHCDLRVCLFFRFVLRMALLNRGVPRPALGSRKGLPPRFAGGLGATAVPGAGAAAASHSWVFSPMSGGSGDRPCQEACALQAALAAPRVGLDAWNGARAAVHSQGRGPPVLGQRSLSTPVSSPGRIARPRQQPDWGHRCPGCSHPGHGCSVHTGLPSTACGSCLFAQKAPGRLPEVRFLGSCFSSESPGAEEFQGFKNFR